MERLTIRKSDFTFPRRGSDAVSVLQCVDRLAAIEDILGDEYDLDRLRELVEDDRDGRCVVLPFKPGDTVYQVDTERVYEFGIKKIIYDCGHIAFEEYAVGKTVFLTREDAEDALKGEQDG